MISDKKNIKKEKKKIGWDDLSTKEKIKIIKKAARKSSEDQLELVKRYEKIYGKD